jgi:signal transduction histidine kinase
MLEEIFLVALVIVVFLLVALDGYRIRSDVPHGPLEASAHDGRAAPAGAARGGRVTSFGQEPAGMGAGPRASAPAPEAGPAGRAESVSPPVGGRQHARTRPPAVRRGRQLKNWRVSSRLLLLAVIPALAVAVAAFLVARLVGTVHGTAIHSPAGSVHDRAVASAIAFGVGAIVALALAAWFAFVTARSMWQPLGRLRAAALQLPDVVHRISESNGQGRPSEVKTIGVDSTDEIGEIARAFDQMRTDFLRQVSNEAAVRAKLNAMFLNLSHRGQSLAERQIRLIDSLEQGEQDAGRRGSLLRMDRIAARMHRSSQNLLILAGHELTTGWNQPVALADVIRSAASEVEDSERVYLTAQPADIAVRGPVVNDLVHLLAELIENATSFSAADMQVDISGQVLATGGALIEITDRGIGMATKEMAHANWQLENPSAADTNIPRWMGLFVVARLAARHGLRVRLHAAEFGGLTALVWLPDDALTHRGATASLRLGGSPSAGSVPRPEPALDLDHAAAGAGARPARSGSGAGERPGPAWSASGQRPAAQAGPPAALRPSGYWPPDAGGGSAGVAGQQVPALSVRPDGALAGSDPAPGGGTAPPLNQERVPADREVILPPAEGLAGSAALPIYDEVESRWFGSGGGQAPGSPGRMAAAGNRWSSSADEGWHAAQAASSPSSGGPTAAGLPKRQPNANLVPGAIPGPPPAAPPRSPAAARDRLAGFQRGVSEGRAALGEAANPGGDDQP